MEKYTQRDLEEMHDEMLNEVFEPMKMGYLEFEPADTMKTMDPVAYRISFGEYVDSLVEDEVIFEHADGEYYDTEEA